MPLYVVFDVPKNNTADCCAGTLPTSIAITSPRSGIPDRLSCGIPSEPAQPWPYREVDPAVLLDSVALRAEARSLRSMRVPLLLPPEFVQPPWV